MIPIKFHLPFNFETTCAFERMRYPHPFLKVPRVQEAMHRRIDWQARTLFVRRYGL